MRSPPCERSDFPVQGIFGARGTPVVIGRLSCKLRFARRLASVAWQHYASWARVLFYVAIWPETIDLVPGRLHCRFETFEDTRNLPFAEDVGVGSHSAFVHEAEMGA